jgi:hypothetical protein
LYFKVHTTILYKLMLYLYHRPFKLCDMFRLEFDQTQLPYYTEIDAVALLGTYVFLNANLVKNPGLNPDLDPIPDPVFFKTCPPERTSIYFKYGMA